MANRFRFSPIALIALFYFSATTVFAGDGLQITTVEPAPRSLRADLDGAITVHFDRPVRPESVIPLQSFWAFGRWSGTVSGTFTFSNNNQTVSLVPNQPFSAGENVMVMLSNELEAADGTFLRQGGFSFQFWVKAKPTTLELEEIDRLTTRTTPSNTSRAYGGLGSDLNGDGYLDLAIINEDTSDVRVFLNQADGTGLYDEFLQPTAAVGAVPSPSEPSDFNRDGWVDIVTANTVGGSASILLGRGDGTFDPQQEITTGGRARGVAVLDADGDGDIDIVTANHSTNNMALLLNNGDGIFGAPSFFADGGIDDRSLAAGDMNEDGILDLVVGGISAAQIWIYTGNGDGTFTLAGQQSSGGATWMLNIGDVNGDGHEDVVTANSSSNVGAILLGDGTGQLGVPESYGTDPFPLATDIGDIDGDGDLDWVTSSFSGDWLLFLNDGLGNFVFDREFIAPQAASCALLLDIDRDHDLDLVLVDELADVVILLRNQGLFSDGFESADTSAWANSTVP